MAETSTLTTVIFDLDGVLVDSEALMRHAFFEAFQRVVGEGEPPIEEYLTHLGEYFPDIMNRMGLPVDMWAVFRDVSSRRLDLVRVFPGVRQVLNCLWDAGVSLGILTGKDHARTEALLSHFSLRDFFGVVITPEAVSRSKPNPDGLYYALMKLGCSASTAVLVGDAINDVVCAKRAGVTSIAALWGTGDVRMRVESVADYVASSPHDLLVLLQREFHIGRSTVR